MAAFEYEALDAAGRTKRGVLSADSPRLARKELRSRRLTPLKIKPAAERTARFSLGSQTPRIGQKDLAAVTRQLSTLVRAAAPIEEALGAVAQQSEKQTVRASLMAVRAKVMEGRRLSDALGEEPKSFSPLYRSMVAAGEAAGDLGAVLGRLADYLEKSQALKRKVTSAMVYPAVLALVATCVVTALMVLVVPEVVEQFDALGQELPLITKIVIGVSDFLRAFGLILLIALLVAGFAVHRALAHPPVRRALDQGLLATPLVGRFTRDINAARFARTLSTLVQSGAPLLDSLRAARNTMGNVVLKEAAADIAVNVQEGASLSASMKRAGVFPPLMVYMTASGETGGELGEILGKSAEYLETEFEAASSVALSLLEPGVIVVMGLLVTMIVLAIMLPIMQFNNLALM